MVPVMMDRFGVAVNQKQYVLTAPGTGVDTRVYTRIRDHRVCTSRISTGNSSNGSSILDSAYSRTSTSWCDSRTLARLIDDFSALHNRRDESDPSLIQAKSCPSFGSPTASSSGVQLEYVWTSRLLGACTIFSLGSAGLFLD